MMQTMRAVKTALVLGGGFGGLSAAIHLALKGVKVTLLEAQAELGGKAGRFEHNGFVFDTGPSVFTLKTVLEDIFKEAGEPFPVRLEPLSPLCRYIYPSGRIWDVYQDIDLTIAQLSSQEASAYINLLNESKNLYESAAPTFVYGPAPTTFDLLRYGLRHGLKAHPGQTLVELLQTYKAGPELTQFFLRFATYFGANPYKAPAVLHNIAWVELGLGIDYPVGGIRATVDALAVLANTLGVEIKTQTKVEKLEHHHHRLSKVHTNQGVFKADTAISSLDILRTHKLLDIPTPLADLEPSLSGFVLLAGVMGQSTLPHHTISFSNNYQGEFAAIDAGQFADDPTLYISIGSKTNASEAPKGCENWFVMANAPALNEHTWDQKMYAEKLLKLLESRKLLKREQIKFVKVLSPTHLAKFSERGSIYGHAPHSLLSTLRPSQRIHGIDNLFLAGGSVHPGGGIPLSLLSGKAAANLAMITTTTTVSSG
jgi:phytoene desaturase